VSVKSLLDKLNALLNEEHKTQVAKYKSLKKVLKALRREKVSLQDSLNNTVDETEKQDIETRLKVISAQRKKGLVILKKLKSERDRGS
jgi:ribosomal protein L31E